MAMIIMYLTFNFFGSYREFIQKKFPQIHWIMVKSISVAVFILITLLFLLDMQDVSRILLGIFYLNLLALLTVSKGFMFIVLRKYEQKEYNIPNVIIIGSRERAKQVIDLIQSSAKKLNIIGCLEIDKKRVGKKIFNDIRVLGTMYDLKDIILKDVVDEIIFAMPLKMIEHVDKYLLLLEEIGIQVRIIPEWHIHSLLYKPKVASILFDDFHGIPTLLVTPTTTLHRDLFLKNLYDYILTAIMFILFVPFFIIIGILIVCFSWGPVFFAQERVGLNGRKFMIYKFRTMVPEAEKSIKELQNLNEADGPVFKMKKDPRIIPFVGTILRNTSLDELPQLINILKGEMSLIGPRPPIQSEVEQYDVWQRRRLSMKPGLTCIWQISPNRNDIDFNTWMEMDLEYIDNWSLKLDFLLLWKTFLVVFGMYGR